MSYQKLQPSRCIGVVPNDTYNIFSPSSLVSSGKATSGTNQVPLSNALIDANADFISAGVQVGDIIHKDRYNASNGKNRCALGEVTNVDSATELTVSFVADNTPPTPTAFQIFTGQTYKIFRPSENRNGGCILYIGSASSGNTIKVLTAANEELTVTGLSQGSFTPFQVVKVFDTGTNVQDIIAFW